MAVGRYLPRYLRAVAVRREIPLFRPEWIIDFPEGRLNLPKRTSFNSTVTEAPAFTYTCFTNDKQTITSITALKSPKNRHP